VFCRLYFVLLSFFFWPLYCLIRFADSYFPFDIFKLINEPHSAFCATTYRTTLLTQLCVKVGILLTRAKHLHDRITSIRRDIWTNKTNLTTPLIIVVYVPSQVIEPSCICVLEVMYMCVRGINFACFFYILY
jgi:hypothetical protein